MRKCIVVIQNLTRSGSPQTFLHVIEVLKKRGFLVDAYVYALRNKKTDLYYLDDYKNVCGHIYFSHIKLNGLIYKFFPFLKFYKIKKIINQNRYDLVLSNNIYFIADCSAHRDCIRNTKLIYYALGNVNIKSKYTILNKKEKYIRKYIRDIDAYIALSSLAIPIDDITPKNKLFNLMDYPDEYYSETKKETHNGLVLGQIGYYCSNKNQLFSLSVLNKLVLRNEKVHMFFVGYPSSEEPCYYEKMVSFIKKNNLASFITFLPPNYSKKEFFKSVDLLLLPSIHEGLSLTLMEGQFSNTFCLVSKGVPVDVNFGLCDFINLDSDNWVQAIIKFDKTKKYRPNFIYKKEEFEKTLSLIIDKVFITKI